MLSAVIHLELDLSFVIQRLQIVVVVLYLISPISSVMSILIRAVR